ncbi:unnamed protein product [Victoria cruziana]
MAIGVFVHLLLLLAASVVNHGSCYPVDSNVSSTLVPIGGQVIRPYLNESRRRLGSFQICALCTCCDGPRRLCLVSPCCYAITCNIPNRPFGFCSFVPKTCNCFGCSL